MDKNILVTYSTKLGSTKEVAEKIGKTLKEKENNVDVFNIEDVINLQKYDTVIVGSPIRYDKWMNEARDFLKNNTKVLKNKRLFYFFVCLTLSSKSERSTKRGQKYAEYIRNINPSLNPIDVKGFAGAVELKRVPFHTRYILKFLLKLKGASEGDYRDWNEIEKWAQEV
ncbi:MAG: flavodoxin domain-containing protein [Candidatus Dojkabacteria bacterium]|nr:flavodoxin domain-containing protein [Candidatus Dojkabacteria bacterium]MDQ7021881.1 flavodoxin domain-containing protein [Candidatus Dojkabacteria bacterium]